MGFMTVSGQQLDNIEKIDLETEYFEIREKADSGNAEATVSVAATGTNRLLDTNPPIANIARAPRMSHTVGKNTYCSRPTM